MFFEDGDYRLYRDLLSHAGAGYEIAVESAPEQGLKLPGITG